MMRTDRYPTGRDELLAAVDLPALWAELVGARGRSGGWPCPIRDHTQTGATPPVSITADRGLWHCHGCGAGGTAVDLLVVVHGYTVADAFAELAGAPPRRPHRAPSAPLPPAEPPTPVVSSTPVVAPEVAGDVLANFLRGRGWRADVADRAGLHVVADRWGRPRVRVPYRSAGEVVWWQDRATTDSGPRWLAPVGRRPWPYAIDDLAAASQGSRDLGCWLIVEGPSDLIALAHAWPVAYAIALPGTSALPPEDVAATMGGLDVITMFDADAAGDRLRSALGGAALAAGCRVGHVVPPAPDLDDWRRRCGCDDDRWRAEMDAALDRLDHVEVTDEA